MEVLFFLRSLQGHWFTKFSLGAELYTVTLLSTGWEICEFVMPWSFSLAIIAANWERRTWGSSVEIVPLGPLLGPPCFICWAMCDFFFLFWTSADILLVFQSSLHGINLCRRPHIIVCFSYNQLFVFNCVVFLLVTFTEPVCGRLQIIPINSRGPKLSWTLQVSKDNRFTVIKSLCSQLFTGQLHDDMIAAYRCN